LLSESRPTNQPTQNNTNNTRSYHKPSKSKQIVSDTGLDSGSRNNLFIIYVWKFFC
jgi:hypothetical protein